MHARAVDDAALRLRELRHEEWEDLGLSGAALSLAVVASEAFSELAWPLFVGGVVIGAKGVRALWRRWDLLERLSGEREAFAIPEVLAFATREATMDRRTSLATSLRSEVVSTSDERPCDVSAEIEMLACELEDSGLVLDPVCAISCVRLLNDLDHSPLLNPDFPPEDLLDRVREIRSGFSSASAA
jgi:hypothetical protein